VAKTNATQKAVSAVNHPARTSLPVPAPCSTAIGQQAYAIRYSIRQVLYDKRRRSALVIASAKTSSARDHAEAKPIGTIARSKWDDRISPPQACGTGQDRGDDVDERENTICEANTLLAVYASTENRGQS
jgi:hypothetical protein